MANESTNRAAAADVSAELPSPTRTTCTLATTLRGWEGPGVAAGEAVTLGVGNGVARDVGVMVGVVPNVAEGVTPDPPTGSSANTARNMVLVGAVASSVHVLVATA